MLRQIPIPRLVPFRGIYDYWRGDCPPWIALFVVLIGGRLVSVWMWQALPSPLSPPLFALLALGDLTLALWQAVGAWRSLSRGIDARAKSHVLFAARASVIVVAVFILTHAIDQAARQTAALQPTRFVAPKPLEVRGGVAYLTGVLGYDLLARFDATPASSFTTLDLDSAGGQVFAARAIAQRVIARGLRTRVSTRCYSACTLIFMAGAHRDLGPKGELGFHGYGFQITPPLFDITEQEAIDRSFLRDHGVAESFLRRAYAIPHDEIWRPDRQILAAAGVLRN